MDALLRQLGNEFNSNGMPQMAADLYESAGWLSCVELDYEKAIVYFERALDLLTEMHVSGPGDQTAKLHLALSYVYKMQKRDTARELRIALKQAINPMLRTSIEHMIESL